MLVQCLRVDQSLHVSRMCPNVRVWIVRFPGRQGLDSIAKMTSKTSIVIASLARTPITKFRGSFTGLKGSELAAFAIRGAFERLSGDVVTVPEAILGNVVSAGMGQAPARQAVLGAGMPQSTICTTINKVCASGMKSVMLGTLQCTLSKQPVLAGGFESMSNVPHYLQSSRSGTALGNAKLIDGVIHDGLWDIYNDQHMGMCAEKCSKDYSISREEQDAYTIESYSRAQKAIESAVFDEVVPVPVPQRQGDPLLVVNDEEPAAVKLDKIPSLKPAFDRNGGTVTAANASSLNDGACAMVLMTEEDALDRNIAPLARIVGFGDAAQDPVDFTTSPALAIPVALKTAGLTLSDIDYHEINEAFAVVALANAQLLNLDLGKVNVFGGAVALGHPIGMSGARIIGTLYQALKHNDANIGCASICNGGGGASAIIIERLN